MSVSHALENFREILAQNGIFPTTCSVNICTKTSVTKYKMYTKSIRMSELGEKSKVCKIESGWSIATTSAEERKISQAAYKDNVNKQGVDNLKVCTQSDTSACKHMRLILWRN